MQALIGQLFAIAGVLWYAAVVICLILELTGRGLQMGVLRVSAPVFVWGYSIIATIYVWAMDGFGPSADGTCWITTGNWYRLTFFIPVWISMMLGFILLGCALCNCNALGRRLPCYSVTRSILFMAAFIFVWIWVVVLRIYEAVVPNEEVPETLIVLHACGVSSQGLVNFLLWVTSPSLAAVLAPPAFCKRLRCCNDSELSLPLQGNTPSARAMNNSLSIQGELVFSDPRLNPDDRPSFGAELTPRTHEELLMLAEENVESPIAEYRGLAD